MTKRLTGFYARGQTGTPEPPRGRYNEPGNSLRCLLPRKPSREPTDLQKAIYDFCVNGGWEAEMGDEDGQSSGTVPGAVPGAVPEEPKEKPVEDMTMAEMLELI